MTSGPSSRTRTTTTPTNGAREYAALAEKPDFAEKSQYKSTANGQEKFNAWSGTYSNSGFDDIAYDYINRNEEARSRQMLSDIRATRPCWAWTTASGGR